MHKISEGQRPAIPSGTGPVSTDKTSKIGEISKVIIDSTPNSDADNKSIWLKSAKWIPKFVLKKVLKGAEFYVIDGGDKLDKIRENSQRKLIDLLQDSDAALVLDALSAQIAQEIKNNASDDELIKEFFAEESAFLTRLISALLPQIVLQFAQAAKTSENEVTIQMIISYVLGLVTDHFIAIGPEIDKIEADQTLGDSEKLSQLREIHASFIQSFLKIAFPNGSKDLPLKNLPGVMQLKEYLWTNLQNEWLPDLLNNFYHKIVDPIEQSKIEDLSVLKGGEFVSPVFDFFNKKVQQWIPEVLASQADNLAAEAAPYIFPPFDELPTGLQKEMENSEEQWNETKGILQLWVANQLRQLGKSEDPQILKLWGFAGEGLEIIVAHALFNLATNKAEDEEIGAAVLRTLFSKLRDFSKQFENPTLENFRQLALDLKEMMGLDKIPYSTLLESGVNAVFDTHLPAYMQQHYHDYLLPIADFYETFENPISANSHEKLKNYPNGGTELAEAVQFISHLFYEETPAVLLKNKQEIASNAVAVLPEDEVDLKKFMQAWIEERIEVLAGEKEGKIGNLWKLAESNLNSLLTYVLDNFATEFKYSDRNVYHAVINKFAVHAVDFLRLNEELIRKKYLEIHSQGKNPGEEPEFTELFKALAEKILSHANPEAVEKTPFNQKISSIGETIFIDQMPKLFASFYCEFIAPEHNKKEYLDRLQLLIGSDKAESIVSFFGTKLNSFIKASLQEKFGKEFSFLNDSTTMQVWETHVHGAIETLLLKVFVNFGENYHQNLLTDLASYLPEAHSKAQEAMKIADQKERQLALLEAFKPAASNLLKMGSPAFSLQEVPVIAPLKQKVWDLVEQELLPKLLVQLYVDHAEWVGSWDAQAAAYRNSIKQNTQTSYTTEACHHIAQWVSDFAPIYLANENETVANTLYASVQEFLSAEKGVYGNSVDEFLKQHEQQLKGVFAQNIYSLASGPMSGPPQKVMKDYLETVLLKFFDGLTGRISSLTSPEHSAFQEEFVTKVAIRFLNVAKDHFAKLNEIKKKEKKSNAHEIDSEKIYEGFGDLLHKGIPNSEEAKDSRIRIKESQKIIASERRRLKKLRGIAAISKAKGRIKEAKAIIAEEKSKLSQFRIDNFYKPLASELLSAVEINSAADMPFVSAYEKEFVYTKFREEIVPLLLENLFDETLKPRNRNLMFLAVMRSLGESLDKPDQPEDFVPPPKDELQKKMDTACGGLILQMTNMFPKTILAVIFKVNKVKDLSAEVVGSSFRSLLMEEGSALNFLDMGLEAAIEGMYPGKWEGKGLDAKYVPESTDIRAEFPKRNADEKEQWEIESEERDRLLEAQTKRVTVAVERKIIGNLFLKFLSFPVVKINGFVNSIMKNHFPNASYEVKTYVDHLCHKILFNVIGAGLSFLSYPIRKIFWYFTEMYLAYRAEQMIKTWQMEVHENLFNRWAEELVQSLNQKDDSPSLSFLIESLVNHF